MRRFALVWLGFCAAGGLACGESALSEATCPAGAETVELADADACVTSVVETGFLCAASMPYRFERDGVVICTNAPDLPEAEVERIATERPGRGGPAATEGSQPADREADPSSSRDPEEADEEDDDDQPPTRDEHAPTRPPRGARSHD